MSNIGFVLNLLESPSQSPDLNPVEMLWNDLKSVIHPPHPKNMGELRHFWKDEWSNVSPGHILEVPWSKL